MKNIALLLLSSILFIPATAIAQTASAQHYLDRGIARYQSGNKQDEANLPTVKNAVEIEKSIGKPVKLVGTYIGNASILSHKESSSGGTFLVLQANIVISDNSKVSLSSKEPMLGQWMRSIDEIKKYHDREVVVTGKIAGKGDHLSIIPEKIELLRSSSVLPLNYRTIIKSVANTEIYPGKYGGSSAKWLPDYVGTIQILQTKETKNLYQQYTAIADIELKEKSKSDSQPSSKDR
jgi:hypothetical protein